MHVEYAGSMTELVYTLQTFGIPDFAIPRDDTGEISVDPHVQRMLTHRMQEQQLALRPALLASASTTSSSANDEGIVPVVTESSLDNAQPPNGPRRLHSLRNSDVWLGRGFRTRNHVGNGESRHFTVSNADTTSCPLAVLICLFQTLQSDFDSWWRSTWTCMITPPNWENKSSPSS